MRLGNHTACFEFASIPMVGNFDNGAVIGLTPEGANVCAKMAEEDVAEETVAAVDPSLLECLKAGNFSEGQGQPPTLKSAYLHVTQRCNLDCAGCYSLDAKRNHLGDASFENICRAVEELARGGISHLIISGGEPFLRKDLPDILRYAKESCSINSIDILTNGTLLTRENVAPLSGLANRISVSFDGWSDDCEAPIRGSQRYSQLAHAMSLIQECGISSHVIATIHAQNIDDMERYTDMADSLGATINFSLLSCPSSSETDPFIPNENELKLLAQKILELGSKRQTTLTDAPVSSTIMTRRSCGAGCRTVSVAADGQVYPCHFLHLEEYSMGNLFESRIEDVLNGATGELCQSLDASEFDGCSTCSIKHICGGGCRARSVFFDQNIKGKDSYCALMEEYYGQIGRLLSASLSSNDERG